MSERSGAPLSSRKRVRERPPAAPSVELGLCGWCGGRRGFHDDGVCRRPDRPHPRVAVLARALADTNEARDVLERVKAVATVLPGRVELLLLRVLDDLGRIADELAGP